MYYVILNGQSFETQCICLPQHFKMEKWSGTKAKTQKQQNSQTYHFRTKIETIAMTNGNK